MRITIYNEPAASSPGGSEFCSAVLAEALSREHSVRLAHHYPQLTREKFEQLFRVNLERVQLDCLPRDRNWHGSSWLPWRRIRQASNWYANLSADSDIFIALVHHVPPFCHAPTGLLLVLFPMYEFEQHWPWRGNTGGIRGWASRAYYRWEWQCRMRSYKVKAAISNFVQQWSRNRWFIDCELCHPPVDQPVGGAVTKEQRILSVGRFTPSKRQREMASFFADIALRLPEWTYQLVGNRGAAGEDAAYYQELATRTKGISQIALMPNLPLTQLRDLYCRASIFWHGMGYGVEGQPSAMEHFGISTVEAMAAGCVPVVFNRGGQSEIVQHGVNGFVWDTPDELKQFTQRLAGDPILLDRMSQAARVRARDFTRQKFLDKIYTLLSPALHRNGGSVAEKGMSEEIKDQQREPSQA